MALIDQIDENVIKTPLVSTTKEELVGELVQILADAGRITDVEACLQAVREREALGSTGLENGIAVPHAKTGAVSELAVAIGIAPSGIDFAALDGKPSQLFFLLLAPPGQSGPHIEALSEIARLTKSQAFCRVLLSAGSAAEVLELLQD
jgi:fructose-specific phosphotransferase system IIA component